MNILFVCTGNTCRSPMAEGYLRSKNIKNISVSSCGLFANGSPVSENSKNAMAEIGIDISSHISRPITRKDIEKADKIICMSPSHLQPLSDICKDKVSVLGSGISDPFGLDINAYRLCRDQIIKEIDNLFGKITITPLKEEQIKYIAELEKACFSTPWSEITIKDAFQKGTNFFLALQNGEVLGYLGISVILDEGYITNVAVFPNARKKGVATKLLDYLFDFAKKKALSFVTLEVRESNIPAISLYKKFGFENVATRKNFYDNPKENAIIMTKRF